LAAAVVQARAGTGSSVSWASAETNVAFCLADVVTGTSNPIPIPTTTGTNFSWIKNLVLYVTTAGTTSMSNRTVNVASSLSTGLAFHWKDVAVASYAQAASGNRPATSGSNGNVPTGYTAMTTSPAQYDNTSVSTSSTGPCGDMCVCVLGVSGNFAGGAGNAVSLQNISLNYDES
jgi:hypothetical protein